MNLLLSQFRSFKINYNWKTIYVGLLNDFFDEKIISQYSNERVADEEANECLITLSIGNFSFQESIEIICKIKNMYFPNLTENEINLEKRKLRYVYLKQLSKYELDENKLLDKIEDYYESNGYPDDMKDFIRYMPLNKKHFLKWSNRKVIKEFYVFLEKEKEIVSQ